MEYSTTTRRDVATTKKRGSPLLAKACAMVVVLRNSIYGIVSTFHDKMLMSTKAGFLQKDWVSKSNPFFETYELLVHKLRHFLDFQAS
jgi:nucleoporin NDC1